MPIQFRCNHCNKPVQAPDTAAGKSAKCPGCGKTITVPKVEPEDDPLAGFDEFLAGQQQANLQPPPPIPRLQARGAIKPPAPRDTSTRILLVVGYTVILAVLAATGFVILLTGESTPLVTESLDSEPTTDKRASAEPKPKPFEYKILSEDWHVGRAVTVKAQVADDVAPTVTEADLESLVPIFIKKYDGGTFQVIFYTETPLAEAWGSISYIHYNTVGGKLECSINKYAFEMGPWYFPNRIDPHTKWHELVWLTLPMVNKIVNGATQYDWKVTNRSANDVYFESKQSPPGALKDDMNLSPQTWEISTYDGDVPRFVRVVESSLSHLDYKYSQNIVDKLNSVIGSQEYLNGGKTFWTWMMNRLEVTYHHYDTQDAITIIQTMP